jgi:Ca2+-binding RTX toxin-like protein
VPVRVEGGAGSDQVKVGTWSHLLTNVNQTSRPGLNAPFGMGPLEIVGSPRNDAGLLTDSGIDTLVVDDSSDGTGRSGNLTAFVEQRTTVGDDGLGPNNVEVGVISGLGMTLYKHDDSGTTTFPGRIEFEGMEVVAIHAGGGPDSFSIGGDNGLLESAGLAAEGALPQTRQEHVTQFVHTPDASISVDGADGADTINVLSSNVISRNALSTRLNLITDAEAFKGVLNTSDEHQTLTVSSLTGNVGWFTVKYQHLDAFGAVDQVQETQPLPFNASHNEIQAAMRAAFTTVGDPSFITVTGSGAFDVKFDKSLGDVMPLIPVMIPLLVGGGDGTDRLRVQSTYEDLFWKGGDGSDTADLNTNATTLAPFAPTDLVGHIDIQRLQAGVANADPDLALDEIQKVTLRNTIGGTFRLKFGANTTAPIFWDAPAATVQAALVALPNIGKNADNAPNVGVIKNGYSYTIEFVGDRGGQPQAMLTSNFVVNSTQTGDGSHDAIQHVVLQSVETGAFQIDYTYDVKPVSLQADPNHVGSLAAGVYYYKVTAMVGVNETLASRETSSAVGSNGAIELTWGDVKGAVSYKIYRSTTSGAETLYATSPVADYLDTGGGTVTATPVPATTSVHAMQTTVPISYNASAAVVQSTLEALSQIGKGNVSVTGPAVSGLSPNTVRDFTIEFIGALANKPIAMLGGGTSLLRSLGIHALITLDGDADADAYRINLIGGRTASVANVFDTGSTGADSMTVSGTPNPDVFLMRASAGANALAFVALINGPTPLTPLAGDPVERVNYNSTLEAITINGSDGDDQFYIDDTRSAITVNGGEGKDFFQIGQLYKSRRTPALAGVAPQDVFATIDTTQGWLSNGISKPMTINGDVGDDNFIVFHNLDTLNLYGDAGNDTFLVQAFALAGSQEDHRSLTDLSGGAGADLIQYAVNAPVNIDGGDGFDTVVVIGTEFNDDFVATATGIFGAGLNVNFVNIESLTVDGGAGDDRFFVLGTSPGWTTEIDGGLGSDLVSIMGPTPGNGVISNDLLGHSGILTHGVESLTGGSPDGGAYGGLNVVGVSAHVADNDSPGIVVTVQNGIAQVVQGDGTSYSTSDQTLGSYTVVLTRPPDDNVRVVVTATPVPGLAIWNGSQLMRTINNETQVLTIFGAIGGTFTLTLNGTTSDPLNWDASASEVQTALGDVLSDLGIGSASDLDVKQDGTTYAITFLNGLAEEDMSTLVADGTNLTGGTVSVDTTVAGGVSTPTPAQLTFTNSSTCSTDNNCWWVPQTVLFAVDDMAASVPTGGDIQNAAQALCIIDESSLSDPKDCLTPPEPRPTIKGLVGAGGSSVDMNIHTVGDEYATLVAASSVFSYGLPSATLPEGVRGEILSITGGDTEAAGQIRLVLGSYIQKVTVSGGTGSDTFKLKFGDQKTTTLTFGASATTVKAALEALSNIGPGMVAVTKNGDTYKIELRGKLYLSYATQFSATDLTGAETTSSSIDDTSVKLNSPWDVEPLANKATFEIGLFTDVHVPNVKVRVFSHDHPAVVVDESGGNTNVAECSLTAGCDPTAAGAQNNDTVRVRLSSVPVGVVTVTLGDHAAGLLQYYQGGILDNTIDFNSDGLNGHHRWDQFVTVEVRAVDDQVVRGFHKADLVATATAYDDYVASVSVADDNWYGVRVVESNGGTSVIEYQGGDFGVSQSDADSADFPFQDSYTVSLAKAPDAGQVIRITVQAQPTRTSKTGGILSFAQQLIVCVGGSCETASNASFAATKQISFDSTNWNIPRTVWVRSLENDRVDGGDTKVFGPELAQLNNVQGPLFVNGGVGKDRTGLLEREPVMLPGERNETPSMGDVISSTPGAPDGSVPGTVTIDKTTLAQISVQAEAGTSNKIQDIAVNATGGTFTLTYGGNTTVPLAFDAPSVTISDALKALPGIAALLSTPNAYLRVSSNGSVYQVTFLGVTSSVSLLTANGIALKPLTPADLIGFTILITRGPAKNKSRIITQANAISSSAWLLTLEKSWFSPFTNDSSKPDATSEYTLLKTNPNLLVKEEEQANLLFLYDTDNPSSYNDPHLTPNPFGEGRMFYDTSPFGPRDEDGNIANLNQFRITGFGMGHDRCIGGPGDATTGLCTGPVGANEPGGVTFQGMQDIELNLGAGNNHFTIEDTQPGTLTKVNAGGGADVIDVKKISGHTTVNGGAGNDIVNVHNDAMSLSQIAGLLTVSGDSPQANVVNVANGSPAQGTAVSAVDAIQQLTVDATGGTFTLTYAPRPLHLAANQAPGTGALAEGTYYYVVTAITALGESIASSEVFAIVGANGAVDLAWYKVPFATGYRIYRGTTPGGENRYFAPAGTQTSFTDTGGAGTVGTPPANSSATQTVTVNAGASSTTLANTLGALTLIGGAGNLDVQKAGGVYRIHFQGGMGGTAVSLLLTDPALLTNGAGEQDTLNAVNTAGTSNSIDVLTSQSLTGLDMPAANSIQELVIDATSGTYTLDYSYWIFPTNVVANGGLGGTLTAGTHYYVVTAITAAGESVPSAEVSAVTADTGSVSLSWTGIAGATGYRVYRGEHSHTENRYFVTGSTTSFTDVGAAGAVGTPPTTSSVVNTVSTPAPGLSYNATASVVQQALEQLAGTGNVVVTKNDDVYVIRFQGSLSGVPVLPLVVHPSLQKLVEPLGGDPLAGPFGSTTGTAVITTRNPGFASPETNQVQLLTVDATAGSYVISFHVNGVPYQTRPIPYNAGAEALRQALQDAIAIGEEPLNPILREYLAAKVDVTVDRYPAGNWYPGHNISIYMLNFQGFLRRVGGGFGLDTLAVNAAGLTGSATVTTRMDGINYYGVETLNIYAGSGSDVLSVQGTTPGSKGFADLGGIAVTNVSLAAGNDRVFVSSNADLDGASWANVDFLTGNVDDVRGALNLDLGAGRHRLFVSDESATVGDPNIRINDTAPATLNGLAANAEIWITGLAPAGMSYKVDPSGNLYDGVAYWTGSGNDTIFINGTHDRPAIASGHPTRRTTTVLNTGLGNDNVTVNLTVNLMAGSPPDGFFVLNTAGGSATGDPVTHSTGGASDNDTVDASTSTLPLIIFGGFGDDTIRGGSANDIIAGDFARVQYTDVANTMLIAQFGYGGRGDIFSDQVLDPRWVYTFVRDINVRDINTAGQDTIYGNAGEDILIGGAGNDMVDGGLGDDLIFGDAVQLNRRDVDPNFRGAITNPRFQTLTGTQIYSLVTLTLGQALNDGIARSWRDANGTYVPDWAEYTINNLYHSDAIAGTLTNSFGSDYIAGGAADDMIFGQLGNDVIQGDGSIDVPATNTLLCVGDNVGASHTSFQILVGACRDASNNLLINASKDDFAGSDGSDYIEGGAGGDVIFGNQGQDDIIGGSSDLFTLTTPAQRNDLPNTIFGGSGGADIVRNGAGASGDSAHSHDADGIIANNGDIVRLVGVNGSPMTTGFLTFNYDNYTPTERIIPRAFKLLDYTPGGPDLLVGQAGPTVTGAASANGIRDIGALTLASGQAQGTEIHGGNGDDFMYGGPGNDVMFGDGQNDTMIAGYGNDWMSGGDGDDGMLGDDGRLFISREGLTEPLHGLTVARTQALIATGGNIQQALINVTGELLYIALLVPDNLDPLHRQPFTLMPRTLFANDIMYGGLGSDAMHGGPGEDAMSGAEAPILSYVNRYNTAGAQQNSAPLESDFARPFNSGNSLGYNPTTTKFAQYDSVDGLRKILLTATGGLSKTGSGLNWLLNFTASEGPIDTYWIQGQTTYPGVATDGNDAIFGDLGHDWLVGGTGRDRMWAGWGDDVINSDDNLDTHGGLNDQTDTNPSYEDFDFGGAGRDVHFANTGGDRMIDWVGEFNTYVVPFPPFGLPTISDQLLPDLPNFLYDFSKSDGADQTLAARYGSDPLRNGEPFGELGLLKQQDTAYGDQRGRGRDAQQGNQQGTRDVLRSAGTQPINSPGTCCPGPVGGASPLQVSAPTSVDNVGQTSVPTVLSGPSGTAATLTVTDGSTTTTTSGTIADDGLLPAVLDLSGMSDAALTLTLSAGGGSAATATVVKNTVSPRAPGLSSPAYVGLSTSAASTFTITGEPGLFAYISVYDGLLWRDAIGTLDASGSLSLALDLSGLADGTLSVSASLTNPAGSMSFSSSTLVKDTLAPLAPAVALPRFVNLVNRLSVPVLVTGEPGATATVTTTDGTTSVTGSGSIGAAGSVVIGLNLSALRDGGITATAYQTDLAGNSSTAGAAGSATKNTVAPAGGFTINAGGPVINGQAATTNPNLSLKLSFTDSAGLVSMAFSTNGGITFGAAVAYGTSAAVPLTGPDGSYGVAVRVIDGAGNPAVITQQVRLDRAGPAISATMTAPTNNGSYDVGQVVTVNFSGADVDNVASISAVLDKSAIANGSSINTEALTAGTHTITITARDGLGNSSSTTLTFQVHATVGGLTTAVNDGVKKGAITSSVISSKLLALLSLAQTSLTSANVSQAKTYLNAFISLCQQQSGRTITTAYATSLIGWTNDLIARL